MFFRKLIPVIIMSSGISGCYIDATGLSPKTGQSQNQPPQAPAVTMGKAKVRLDVVRVSPNTIGVNGQTELYAQAEEDNGLPIGYKWGADNGVIFSDSGQRVYWSPPAGVKTRTVFNLTVKATSMDGSDTGNVQVIVDPNITP